MSIKLATHLYRNRHGMFYFRVVIPRDLRSQSQQTEIRFSLHTEQRDKAIIRAFPLIAGLPTLIAECSVEGSTDLGGFVLHVGFDEFRRRCFWIENQMKGCPSLVISIPTQE